MTMKTICCGTATRRSKIGLDWTRAVVGVCDRNNDILISSRFDNRFSNICANNFVLLFNLSGLTSWTPLNVECKQIHTHTDGVRCTQLTGENGFPRIYSRQWRNRMKFNASTISLFVYLDKIQLNASCTLNLVRWFGLFGDFISIPFVCTSQTMGFLFCPYVCLFSCHFLNEYSFPIHWMTESHNSNRNRRSFRISYHDKTCCRVRHSQRDWYRVARLSVEYFERCVCCTIWINFPSQLPMT